MNKLTNSVFCIAAAMLMTACASGPKYSQVYNTLPPLGTNQGRVFVYRPGTMFGAAIQPDVHLNGEVVGKAQPGGFFYFDRDPGSYEVSATTEVKRSLSLALEKGDERYVRMGISMGFFVGHVFPELVDSETAKKEIQNCSYIGPALKQP